MRLYKIILASVVGLALAGCSHDVKSNQSSNVANVDPYQPYNRFMFDFNMSLNKGLLEPAVDIYDGSLPPVARSGLHNFFQNVEMPGDIGNDILQGNFKWAGRDIARFFVNTIFGIGGLVDVASTAHLYPRVQSFGLTLAKWGYGNSSYLVLPLLGPSTIRGTLGLVPDYYMTPMNFVIHNRYYWTFKGLQYAQIGSDLLPKMKFITENALDPYVAMRNAYLQNRKHLIEGVETESSGHMERGLHERKSYVGHPEDMDKLHEVSHKKHKGEQDYSLTELA